MNLFRASAEGASSIPGRERAEAARPAAATLALRPTWDVFVSYAREDLEAARMLRDRLVEAGWKAFLSDDDLAAHVGSTPWSERIDQVLDATAVLVLLVTPHALDSKWVTYEWRSVHTSSLSGGRASVVPVCWAGPSPDELPRALRRYQAVDARDDDTREQQLQAMAALVRGCLTERRSLAHADTGQQGLRRPAWHWRRRARWMVAALALIALGALGRELMSPPRPRAAVLSPPVVPLREPTQGLRVISEFEKHDSAQLPTTGTWEEAEHDFAIATRQARAPKRWFAAEQLADGMSALLLGQDAQAEVALRRAVGLDPEWATAHVALSQVLVARDPKQAQAEARRARQLDPGLVIALDALGDAFLYADESPRALEEYRRALALSPESSVRKGKLALALHSADGLYDEEAQRLAHEALQADPQLLAPRLVLAEVALEGRHAANALAQAQAAVSLAPRDARAHLLLGDALQALGRVRQAREAWTAARDLANASALGLPRARFEEVVTALADDRTPPPRTARELEPTVRTRPGPSPSMPTHRSGGLAVDDL